MKKLILMKNIIINMKTIMEIFIILMKKNVLKDITSSIIKVDYVFQKKKNVKIVI